MHKCHTFLTTTTTAAAAVQWWQKSMTAMGFRTYKCRVAQHIQAHIVMHTYTEGECYRHGMGAMAIAILHLHGVASGWRRFDMSIKTPQMDTEDKQKNKTNHNKLANMYIFDFDSIRAQIGLTLNHQWPNAPTQRTCDCTVHTWLLTSYRLASFRWSVSYIYMYIAMQMVQMTRQLWSSKLSIFLFIFTVAIQLKICLKCVWRNKDGCNWR